MVTHGDRRSSAGTMAFPGLGRETKAMADEGLETELRAFERMLPELMKTHPNKFVLFKGPDFIGAWDTLDAAAAQAVLRYGRGPYLIRQVGAPASTLPASVLYRIPSAA